MVAAVKRGLAICFSMLGITAACLLVLWATFPGRESIEYEHWPVTMAASPDDAWMAVVGYHVYSGPGLADASVFETVQLVRRQEKPPDPSYIFTMEPSEGAEGSLRLKWLGPQKFRITAPNKSLIRTRKRWYEDVGVVVKYHPDDPAERARYLKERGLPAD
jgi:hypothetical protein